MREQEELNKAKELLSSGNKISAEEILKKLYESNDLDIKLNSILLLITVIDSIREKDHLIEVVNTGIEIAEELGNEDIKIYLLSRKHYFLMGKITFLTHRMKSLKLAAGTFSWIEFSLEKDKKEYDSISLQREVLLKEVDGLETSINKTLNDNDNHYLRGSVFMSLGDSYGARCLDTQINLMAGSKFAIKIANMHFAKKLKLYKYLIFNVNSRKEVNDCEKKCISFFAKSIEEFKIADKKSELAHAYYNLSIQYSSMYKFNKANECLDVAENLATITNEAYLLKQITMYREKVKDQNRHLRNYVEELGLD